MVFFVAPIEAARPGEARKLVPKRKLTVDDLRFLVAVSRVALEKLQNESPAASETVLLALALEKMEGCARVVEA